MSSNKSVESDLRFKYKRRLELSFVISLAFVTLIFYSFKENNAEPPPLPQIELIFEVLTIPPTVHPKKLIRPTQPVAALEEEDVEMLSDVELEVLFNPEQNIDIDPPPPEPDEVIEIWALSEKPILLHKEIPNYPEFAQKIGIEGRVTVLVIISKKGKVIRATLVGKENMLSEAALAAAMKCTFKPAKQRDRFVKVKMSIPFDFRLR